jgi:hypothetical protein
MTIETNEMPYIIESHDDESVTLKVGSIRARIYGDGWGDANNAAHVLAQYVCGTYELADLRIRLATLRGLVRSVDAALRSVEVNVDDMKRYAAEGVKR